MTAEEEQVPGGTTTLQQLGADPTAAFSPEETLDFSHQQLRHVPTGISASLLANSKFVNFQLNLFPSIPNNLHIFPALVCLDLSSNEFDEYCEFPETLPSTLRAIKLNNCNLSSLPECVANLETLEYLELNDNVLLDIITPHNLQSLKVLKMRNCSLKELTPEMIGPSLKMLDVAGNQIEDIELTSLEHLEVLDLSENNLKFFPQNVLDTMTSIRVFNLNENSMEVAMFHPSFENCHLLERLELSRLGLTRVPDGLLQLKKLKYLDLSQNYIGDIIDIEEYLKQLHGVTNCGCNAAEITSTTEAAVEEVLPEIPLVKKLPFCFLSEQIETPFPDRITQHVYLGSRESAMDLNYLKNKLQVSHILIVTDFLKPPYKEHFNYKVIPVLDTLQANLLQYFDECYEFMEEAVQANTSVLVHCMAGVSRSSSVVIAYLMKKRGMSAEEAFKFVKEKRPIIDPNESFRKQLKKYEIMLHKQQ